MRAAPPVQMRCGRSALWSVAVTVLGGAAFGTLLGWLAWHAGAGAAQLRLTIAGAALLTGAWSWRRLARAPQRVLAWDGQAWWLDGVPGWPQRMMDTGGWMLLRWRDEGGGLRWLPLVPAACGASAHLARAALLAHAEAPRRPARTLFERHG